MTGENELDPVIHAPARLRVVVTLATLRDGDCNGAVMIPNRGLVVCDMELLVLPSSSVDVCTSRVPGRVPHPLCGMLRPASLDPSRPRRCTTADLWND